MKRNKYITADWHFGASNIIKYCKRPQYDPRDFKQHFKWVTDGAWISEEVKAQKSREMENLIVQNYNKIVRDQDIVYVVGDVGIDLSPVAKMKGIKILITGNHDKENEAKYLNAGFAAVFTAAQIKRGKQTFNLQHYPNRTFREVLSVAYRYLINPDKKGKSWKNRWKRFKKELGMYKKNRRIDGNICLVGHVHDHWLTRGKNINVGVDVHSFKPVNIDKIIQLAKDKGLINVRKNKQKRTKKLKSLT